MKKVVSVLLVLVMAFALVGCSSKSKTSEIAMITDKGNVDDKSFNQCTWEGVEKFAKDNNITHQYIKPEAYDDAGYLKAIDDAVTGGAKVVVTPGFLFEVAVFEAQKKYPNVKFILLDGEPHKAKSNEIVISSNTACIKYEEEQAGYLAGYAAIKDGYTKLGFMGGMAVPAVQAYGYGYLQGAEAAAKELGLADGSVNVTYHYTGDFAETDTNKATAKTMYQEGTQVIFACGGSVGKSVMAAATEAGAKVIGVDSDQRYDNETVITSAMKDLSGTVIAALNSIYKDNSWNNYAGKTTYFTAANNGIGLPTTVIGKADGNAFDRFKSFDKAAYDTVYATLSNGSVVPVRTFTVADANGYATAEELTKNLALAKVAVTCRQ